MAYFEASLTLVGGLIVSPEQNQQRQERGRRQQREKSQRRRQGSSRIFSNGVDVEDERPPEHQLCQQALEELTAK
jgi:hypothetical protein